MEMDVIEILYDAFEENEQKQNPQQKRLLDLTNRLIEELVTMVGESNRHLVNELADSVGMSSAYDCRNAFAGGFRLGSRLALELEAGE